MARRMPPITVEVQDVDIYDPANMAEGPLQLDVPAAMRPIVPEEARRQVFDPMVIRSSLRAIIREQDPRYWAIMTKFRDRQQYGRIAYETAYQHEVVGAAFDALLALLISKKPLFKPSVRNPTQTQLDMAEFANFTVSQLEWNKFIDGTIGQGLEFGFSLTEIVTKYGTWKGNDAILLDCLYPLPQASLDHGFMVREDYGEAFISRDGRYGCFDLDEKGRVIAYIQFAYTGDRNQQLRWEGRDRQRILHYTHKGGDGNPWGQSALFHTMAAWSNLYALEKMEDAFLDTALPWLFGTYKSTAGETRQKVHDGAKQALSKAHIDAAHRFMMWADGDLKSVAPSNENFTDHVFRRKAELEARVWQTLLFPKDMIAGAEENEGDSRTRVQVFFKNTMKARLEEIGNLVTDLVMRLLRSNFSNIQTEDNPVCTWSLVTENETRVAQGLLQAVLPHIKSDTMPDFVHSLFDFVDPNFIAEKHSESVAIKRPLELPETTGPSEPPKKEFGSERARMDGQTENAGAVVGTST